MIKVFCPNPDMVKALATSSGDAHAISALLGNGLNEFYLQGARLSDANPHCKLARRAEIRDGAKGARGIIRDKKMAHPKLFNPSVTGSFEVINNPSILECGTLQTEVFQIFQAVSKVILSLSANAYHLPKLVPGLLMTKCLGP